MWRKSFLMLLAPALLCAACGGRPREAEITIASSPSGAAVTLQGAKLGVTPYMIKVTEDTNVLIELEGYVQQALLVRPDGPPNVAVTLIPVPTPEPTAHMEETAAASPPKPAGIDDIREAKEAYQAGKIDRVEYDQIANRLRSTYRSEAEKLKTAYREGRIDRVEYDQRIRALRTRYRG